MKINAEQKSIPFRLCTTGPGASVRLTHMHPNEMVKPTWKKLKYEPNKAGSRMAKVVRKPSAKAWL